MLRAASEVGPTSHAYSQPIRGIVHAELGEMVINRRRYLLLDDEATAWRRRG
jgi:hypothetical protein